MKNTAAITTAGAALLALTGCVSLGPGEGQTTSPTPPPTDPPEGTENTENAESTEEQLIHPIQDEELHTEILAAKDDVEHLRADMTMSFDLEAPGVSDSQYLELVTEGAEDFSEGHASGHLEEHGRTVETIEAYFHPDGTFQNFDGQGWEEVGAEDLGGEEDSRYSNVVDGLAEIDDLLDVSYHEDTYTLSYTGSDAEVFDAFEEPFALNLDGFEPEDTTMTLEADVDSSTFHLDTFAFSLDAEESTVPVEMGMEITADYSAVNEVPDMEIPDEVFEEAGSDAGR